MQTIDVNRLIDEARFNRFHWRVLCWCALLLIFDGYDLFIYGVVLPVLMKTWSLTPLEAGALGSYALFGMMFGALFFGPLADRIGRKKGIAICFLLFSGFTVLNGFTRNPLEFGICRFMAGLGIYMLPRFGWEAMFQAAAVPLLLLPLILWFLPESVGYLLRQGRTEQARAILRRIDPDRVLQDDDLLEMAEAKSEGAPVLQLFREGRALSTLSIWVAFFCCLLMVYALSSWLPKMMASAGYSLGSSLSFLLALNFGAVFGAIGGGWLGDRLNLPKVLVAFFAVAALSIGLLGFKSPTPVLYTLIALAGATTIGSQILLYACAAQFYAMAIRSTGLGWASGIGRNGAIVGPLLGGALVGMSLPLQVNFIAFAIPGLIAAIAMTLFCVHRQATGAAAGEALA
ncbi:MFS transporter [Azotobacter salinestris]|uniref:MFS transporter n=1 Tax=Azotobacter salinestris TaxID=69964 RepID=UPI001266CB54|nr:MFS transporter [Azotobacter salinestris]